MDCPWKGHPTGPEEGSIKSGSNVPTPRVPSVPHRTRWLILEHYVRFLRPTLPGAAEGDLHPHTGGAESHQAHPTCPRSS